MPQLRLIIRPPQPSDATDFIAAARASAALHHPWVKPPATIAAFKRYLKHVADPRHDPNLIILKSTAQLVGVINISEIVRGPFRSAFLGYYAFTPFAGQGLMTHAMRLVLRRAFTTLKLHRVEANIQPDNTRSIELVKRCGFTLEGFSRRYLKIAGRWRDHQRWALLAEDFKPRR